MKTLTFDIETHARKLMYTMPPAQFVRLIGYAWDNEDPVITTDLEEIREQILRADLVVGHNIHDFDLRAIFGIYSNIPMRLADKGRTYDTWTHAVLTHPAPPRYINRYGKPARATKPEEMLKWFGLDEQAHQLGVEGKTHDLKDLALKWCPTKVTEWVELYGSEDGFIAGLNKKARIERGLGLIPVDDPEYVEYLKGDVIAGRAVGKALLRKGPLDDYARREQRIESRKAAISSNGWRVDQERALARVAELAGRRDKIMAAMVENYAFPNDPTKKQPWRSNQGKEAIIKALADRGVDEGTRPGWKRTEKGDLSLGGEVLLDITKDTEAEELGTALAELMGQRSLAKLALDSMYPDGKVHPEITMLQRSGRWSTTEPGLTIWTARGKGAVEKEYFLPDNENEVLLEIDASNADARIVAWYSGDTAYAVRFQPGQDGHLLNAQAAWGIDVVGTDKHEEHTAHYRQMAKPLGHGWSYGGGYKTLSAQAGVPLQDSKAFCDGMAKAYPRIIAWQNAVRAFARSKGYVKNRWGRKMWVEPGREYTQAPALMGQSGTRELMCDALLAMPYNVVRKVKAQIHDALVFSVPKDRFEECRDYLVNLMTVTLEKPPGGQEMHFPMEAGPPGTNWRTADHAAA